MVLDRTWRLCDTLLALWYFNEPVPHICLHHFGEYSFDPCPAADEAPLGTVIGESVGKLKNVLVDRVETIELPLAT